MSKNKQLDFSRYNASSKNVDNVQPTPLVGARTCQTFQSIEANRNQSFQQQQFDKLISQTQQRTETKDNSQKSGFVQTNIQSYNIQQQCSPVESNQDFHSPIIKNFFRKQYVGKEYMDSAGESSDNCSEYNGNCSILDKSQDISYQREVRRSSYFSQFKNNNEQILQNNQEQLKEENKDNERPKSQSKQQKSSSKEIIKNQKHRQSKY